MTGIINRSLSAESKSRRQCGLSVDHLPFEAMSWLLLRKPLKIARITPFSSRIVHHNPSWSRMASTRTASAKSEKLPVSEVLPPKPKTNTNLRKTASASLSIRETPTATRGAIRPVFTLSTAERYILPPLLNVMKSSNATMLAEALWLPVVHVHGRQASNSETDDEQAIGEAFVFENGCAVFWGVEEDDARHFLNNLVRKNGVEIGRYAEEEIEEVEFVTDPAE